MVALFEKAWSMASVELRDDEELLQIAWALSTAWGHDLNGRIGPLRPWIKMFMPGAQQFFIKKRFLVL